MGGTCVDTNQNLGKKLTNVVRNYLSVAGVGRYTTSCGVNCGNNCGGQYLNDINSKSHYEGQNVMVLQSTADQTITKDRCGTFISELRGADKIVTLNGFGHVEVCLQTANTQYEMLNGLR